MQRLEPRRSHQKFIPWSFDSPTEPPPPPLPDYPDCSPRRPGWLARAADRLGCRRGLLESFTKMPLDIMFEVLSYLHPQDVLNLARTSKQLRGILMNPSSKVIWMASFANVQGMPDCPPDLTEPQYANLAFDTHCHFCLTPGVRTILWTCHVRCCKACMAMHFKTETELESLLLDYEVIVYQHCYISIFPYIIRPDTRHNRYPTILYYLPAAEKYIRELSKLDQSQLAQWTEQKKLKQTQRMNHASLCESWNVHWSFEPATDFNALIVACLAAILYWLWCDSLR